MQDIEKQIQEILLNQAPIYSGVSGKGINAVAELLSLFDQLRQESWKDGYNIGYGIGKAEEKVRNAKEKLKELWTIGK